MSEQSRSFRVYIIGQQTAAEAVEITAADTREAAQKFIAGLGTAGTDIEIAVITSNDFEDVYGYRNLVPQAHLDD